MAEKASAANPALPLHEVLEAEFVALHGELPADYSQSAKETDRLKAIWSQIHRLDEKRAALCISGGGIRSATFGLGVLQGLASCGLLEKFHFLSTVSGGGYIGGWLSAWIHRARGGLAMVVKQLAGECDETLPNPEPVEIQNLRSYSNYLSPRLGLLSADSWTLIATYIRNLFLTSLVLLPLLAAFLTIPWCYATVLMTNPPPYTSIPAWAGAACVALAVIFMGRNLPGGGNKERNQNQFLVFCLLPLFLSAIFITSYWAWFNYYGRKLPVWPLFGIFRPHESAVFIYFGIGIHVAAWIFSLLRAHGFKLAEFFVVVISGGIGGWLLWLTAAKIFPQPLAQAELYSCFGLPAFLLLFFLAMVVFAGISSRWTKDEDREWWGRASGWILVVIVAWTLFSVLVVFGSLLLTWAVSWTVSLVTTGALAGLVTFFLGRSGRVPATENDSKSGPGAWLLSRLGTIAAVVFITVLAIFLIKAMSWAMAQIIVALRPDWKFNIKSQLLGETVEYLNVILFTPPLLVGLMGAALALFACVMAYIINPNRFSLHAVYRDRLIRAYLGASHKERHENPFTGFDPKDNLRMPHLWMAAQHQGKLLPIINVTLNLVRGSKLAWQERKAESFTISPLHCGSPAVGYRKTDAPADQSYGGADGVSLGTAVAISGAAASPNMGYHSSPLVTFVLTLLNVRLGSWLGNPGPAGDKTFNLGYPKFSVAPILAEAFGLTNDDNPYVYLSDGGHFENLGLYEIVLRRCHYVVISDAGEDPKCSFADLGDALRKIRIDLGISIEFEPMTIYPRTYQRRANEPGHNCALGRICYSDVDGADAPDGVIVYIKPACYGDEPRDIYEYFVRCPTFPHESTADQFFSESQFESYRMLGRYTMNKLCPGRAAGFDEFVSAIFRDHLGAPLPAWIDHPGPART